jgi:hypothetical protein
LRGLHKFAGFLTVFSSFESAQSVKSAAHFPQALFVVQSCAEQVGQHTWRARRFDRLPIRWCWPPDCMHEIWCNSGGLIACRSGGAGRRQIAWYGLGARVGKKWSRSPNRLPRIVELSQAGNVFCSSLTEWQSGLKAAHLTVRDIPPKGFFPLDIDGQKTRSTVSI